MNKNLKKETAQEVPVQEQPSVNINRLRVENGLKPILNGDACFIPLKDNFSTSTGQKLNETCNKCWVKGNKPYNCGFDKCPGYRLHLLNATHP